MWTGRKVDEKFIEVKSGGSKLSKKQRSAKRKLGRKYKVERVGDFTFGNDISLFRSSKKKKRKKGGWLF